MGHDEDLVGAAKRAAVKKLQAAVSAGANLEALDEEGFTALQLLCKSKSRRMSNTEAIAALWLIQHGADVNARTAVHGKTPLHLVAGSGNLAVMNALVAKGAVVTRDAYGNTPLFYCLTTTHKNTTLWDRLLELGCKLTDANDAGDTPLLEAEVNWNEIAVRYLLAKGADPNVRDNQGRTALDRAIAYKQATIIALLGGEQQHALVQGH